MLGKREGHTRAHLDGAGSPGERGACWRRVRAAIRAHLGGTGSPVRKGGMLGKREGRSQGSHIFPSMIKLKNKLKEGLNENRKLPTFLNERRHDITLTLLVKNPGVGKSLQTCL
jgi:hypothetical protein